MPYEDIVGADETGIEVIPRAKRTLAPRGSRQVPGTAKKAVAQITKMTAMTYTGILLPYMLIFAGKTEAVRPKDVRPAAGSCYSHSPSHFANAATTKEWAEKILIPFIKAQRQGRVDKNESTKEREDQRCAILIWDNFSAHSNPEVVALLEANRIKPFFLPPNCTSLYQALDVLFNGVEKVCLKNHFSQWHFRALAELVDEDLENNVDVLPKTAAKKRSLIAVLIRGVHELLAQKKAMMLKAWDLTGLFPDTRPSEDLGDLEVNNEVVEAMRELVLDVAEMDVDEVDSDFEPVRDDTAPDAEQHRNNINLDESDEPFDYDEQAAMEEEQEQMEEENRLPSPKRRSLVDEASTMVDDASSSAESTHVVHLTRPIDNAVLQVNFASRYKPSPERVVEELKAVRGIPNTATLDSTTEIPNGYHIILGGRASHASAAFNHPTLPFRSRSYLRPSSTN